MNYCNFFGWGGGMMLVGSVVWLLIVALLVLGIIALWKYIKKK